MSKYIEFDVVIPKKSKRKTRKRGGGDITTCNLTPLTEGVTVADLKSKLINPQELNTLNLID
jgi:hypothetical protein